MANVYHSHSEFHSIQLNLDIFKEDVAGEIAQLRHEVTGIHIPPHRYTRVPAAAFLNLIRERLEGVCEVTGVNAGWSVAHRAPPGMTALDALILADDADPELRTANRMECVYALCKWMETTPTHIITLLDEHTPPLIALAQAAGVETQTDT